MSPRLDMIALKIHHLHPTTAPALPARANLFNSNTNTPHLTELELKDRLLAYPAGPHYKNVDPAQLVDHILQAVHMIAPAKDTKHDHLTFDIITALALLFQDIENYGLIPGSSFTRGWMCPIYKKGDRTNMANYRPITLLNTDYKLLTKCMSVRLAEVAPHLIHNDQAGFVKGRSITNQIKLARAVIYHADATEQDGMIVLLDQEKAYDKIKHDYLWEAMREVKIPD